MKRVHVPKYTHFSDYWLRTSAVIHVYKERARRNGYRMFISVYILRRLCIRNSMKFVLICLHTYGTHFVQIWVGS